MARLDKVTRDIKHELSVTNGLLLRGYRLVIPQSLQSETLNKLHAGHQGIRKCRQWASQSVWWPAIGKDIEETINRCRACCTARFQDVEPLLSSDFSDYPWQHVAPDLFEWKKSKYLLLFALHWDCHTIYCYIQWCHQPHEKYLCPSGVPESLLSDNGPQYAAAVFTSFTKEYSFIHITSSPWYPQGNGAAERGVKTVKNLLEKSNDLYVALM